VTEADLKVQELLLDTLGKTELTHCQLYAEEATAGTAPFRGDWPFVLTIDPIDGTKHYADGGNAFSIVVTLYNTQRILYSLRHYPSLDLTLKIIGDDIQLDGQWPEVELIANPETTAVYTSPATEREMAQAMKELQTEGLELKHTREAVKKFGSASLFLAGKVRGYFAGHPNVYDALTVLHFAQARGFKIHGVGKDGRGAFDLGQVFEGPYGIRHYGYYWVIAN